MTEILSKIFIKNHENLSDPSVRKAYGTMSGGIGIAVNMILALTKLLLGALTASIAITADAFNNLSDAGASFITLISFRLSARPADKEHPFGHARLEYIAAMVVSFLILHVGFDLFVDSLGILFGFSQGARSNMGIITYALLAASILLKLWLGLFYRKIGKRIGSDVIFAASKDSIVDSISTGAALASAVLIKLWGFVMLDAIVGIAVSLLIIIAGCRIFNDTKNSLLGEAPVKEVKVGIERIVKSYPEIIGMHDLLVHNYGPNRFIASFHAEVDGSKDIYVLHDMIDNAEREIKASLGIACTIHMDPIAKDDENTNSLYAMLGNIIREFGLEYKIHDFRVVIGKTHTKLIFDLVLPYDDKNDESELVERISRAVLENAPEHYCVITVDRE